MRKMTPHFFKGVAKLLPMAVLAVMTMPAHSIYIDQPGVKNGLQLNVYTSLYPRITTTSSKFNYTLGRPYGSIATIEQVLANQDRKDSDERYRLAGLSSASTQFYARQELNKDWTATGSVYLQYTPNSSRNWGAPWGIGLEYRDDFSLSVGNDSGNIGVGRTDADSVLNNTGTYIIAEYTQIPDLTIVANHAFTGADDTRDRKDFGWHKNNGLSAEYAFNFAPRNVLKVGLASTRSQGHKSPWYTNQPAKNTAYMGSVSYQYGNATIGLDYGKGTEKFNGHWFDELDKTSYGVKVGYQFTPRLAGALSYSHFEADNSKPVSFQDIVKRNIGINDTRYFFNKTESDRYRAEASYSVWRGISLIGSVESSKSRHFVTEGEFAKRESLTATAGARFTF